MKITQQDLTSLTEQVAENLEGEWRIEPFPNDWGRKGAWLYEDRSGATLSIGESQSPSDRDKLTVSTDYPRGKKGETIPFTTRPKITISASKSGSQIAADITRRLLPEYLPLLQRVQDLLTTRSKREEKSSTTASQIAALVKVRHSPGNTNVSFYDSPYEIFRKTMSEAHVLNTDEVELSLRLDPVTALRLLNLVIHGDDRVPPPEDLRPYKD